VLLGAGLEGLDGRCVGFSEWNGIVSLFFFLSRAEAWALELSCRGVAGDGGRLPSSLCSADANAYC
jgi:hypothetical protein